MKFLLLALLLVMSSSLEGQRIMLLRDEGMSKLSLVNLANPSAGWQVDVPAGRDLQLIGKGLVLLGTGDGYEEREIATGKKVREVATWKGTIAARRLVNGHTMLIGLDWQDHSGIVLVELGPNVEVLRTIVLPGYTYARLFRQTPRGTFLITADKDVLECDARGNIVWRAEIDGHKSPHAWQAVRLASGETVVSTGYPSNLQFFSENGALIKTIGGPPEVNPHFFSGFQVLPNGNFVVANWQGHGPSFGAKGTQLLEYSSSGELVWTWKQDPAKFSSLQGVIVLDGLDVNHLHIEDHNGVLSPVR
jgi:hypothetical protein